MPSTAERGTVIAVDGDKGSGMIRASSPEGLEEELLGKKDLNDLLIGGVQSLQKKRSGH